MELPKVRCRLVGEDGNAFSILGRWLAEAKRAGWPKEEINKIVNEAMAGDYNHLLNVISSNTEEPDE